VTDEIDRFIATGSKTRFAKHLEHATFVGVAARTPDRVVIGFHEVL
jgi:hypothetical protein